MSRPAWLGTDGNLAFTDSTAASAWAAANPSLVYDGLLATINGSAYIWTSGAWSAVGGGGSSILPCFDTISARDVAYPTPTQCQKIGLKRFCGNGYFEQIYDSGAWRTGPGEAIAIDTFGGVGASFTAVNGVLALASCAIPAGIFAVGETWEAEEIIRSTGTFVSTVTPFLQIGGQDIPSGAATMAAANTQVAIVSRFFVLSGSQFAQISTGSVAGAYKTANLPGGVNFSASAYSASAGTTGSLTKISLRRIY